MKMLLNLSSLYTVIIEFVGRIANKPAGFISITLLLATSGCAGRSPTIEDIAGVWENSDGTMFLFEVDGHFSVQALPRQFASIVPTTKVERGENVSGTGRWFLLSPPNEAAWPSGANWWDVKLIFDPLSSGSGTFGTTVMFTRDEGRPTLFFWLEEEGGPRFELFKEAKVGAASTFAIPAN